MKDHLVDYDWAIRLSCTARFWRVSDHRAPELKAKIVHRGAACMITIVRRPVYIHFTVFHALTERAARRRTCNMFTPELIPGGFEE